MARGNRFILFLAFVLVLAAGVVLGQLWGRLPGQLAPESHPRSWLADQLGLNSQQRSQMDAIWAETRKEMSQLGAQRREMEADRKKAIDRLLSPQQKSEYERINQDFQKQRRSLDARRQELMKQADARSKAMLSPEQRATWDKITRQWKHHGREGTTRPASRPENDQSDGVPEHAR